MREFYPNNSGIEIDLRSEMEQTFTGSSGEISKEQKFLLRKMRLDSNSELIECSCVSTMTKEPDTELQCPFCLGEGYYWDETWIYGYCMYNDTKNHMSAKRTQIQPGRVSAYDKIFYLRYSEIITYNDKIIELKLDSDGNPYIPYKRKGIYLPETIIEYRSDYGRLEYLAIYVNENPSIRVK